MHVAGPRVSVRFSRRAALVVVAAGLALPGSAAAAGQPVLDVRADPLTLLRSAASGGTPVADVLGDLNHDGVVSPADERL